MSTARMEAAPAKTALGQPLAAAARHPSVARASKLAGWLDKAYVDPILGFVVPGLGDITTAAFGLYIVGVAISQKVSAVVIARMLINLAFDTLLGVIPVIGDLFDFVFRANQRNVALLEARHAQRVATAGDWLYVIAAALALALALAVPIYVLSRVLSWLF